ncbi:MAG: DUF3231 family protein [Clostridiales bacterium]|nr:DUF3231 family protein [Clostridiales bacterium]MCF8022140.1 DUF3231 family protein [Clostridiales bacterium]
MVQIGRYHIGKAETAKEPELNAGEAYLLWDQLISRYDILEKNQLYQNFAHDPDFIFLLQQGIKILEKQVDILEEEMNTFKINLPERPPKSVRVNVNSGILGDSFMFKDIFTGIQHFLDSHTRFIRSTTTNDPLRKTLINFLKEELDLYDAIVKYGKTKGWIQVPPMHLV